MLVLSCIVGFMGPFGTYADDSLAGRIAHWWMLLMGAYLLTRPAIAGLHALARKTDLPGTAVTFWGVVVVSAPLAIVWRDIGKNEFRGLDGYTGLLPFSLLCALAVLGVTRWAKSADHRMRAGKRLRLETAREHAQSTPGGNGHSKPPAVLRSRLSPGFQGPVLALQSEDHYVRVHGENGSELLLMRLRDAIAEMAGVEGEQVHRSWWIARHAIATAEPAGRSWKIILKNGAAAPVARDSVERLQTAGILPSHTKVQ
ncbi:hypothetical protein GCM10011494_24960 [Novosphingobium endophyticum]|uniref:HTH LytTR-type domain-containing protein n=1 Tax=Novosphingobium endophyticum TaxID=1955250 RepID=A0A916TTN2_9SPHN|nr:LytTR family DNA-binding domain-containing protein [Novosphingobium endophyticum]GGC05407.1 hypothetical protein GCM10011494_24960 [Novosphingobium endophyticum]